MRTPRIKAGKGQAGLYHCMSRVVGGAFRLGRREKEVFVRLMWRVADFLGIEVLDYAVMSNHYHRLVRVPVVVEPSDPELLARLRAYYGFIAIPNGSPVWRAAQAHSAAAIVSNCVQIKSRMHVF